MAQMVKCLLCKRENSSSIPRTHMKRKRRKLGIVVGTCSPALGMRQGGLWDSMASQTSLIQQLQANKETLSHRTRGLALKD